MDYKIQRLLLFVSFNVPVDTKQSGFIIKFGEELKKKKKKPKLAIQESFVSELQCCW